MTTPTDINPTPTTAPISAAAFLKPTALEQSQIGQAACSTTTNLPCRIPVQVGLFFDGTNNNMERDLNGKRIGVPGLSKKPTPLPNKPMKPETCSHSNVVRLFRAFPENKQDSGYFRYYIPGVGTEFDKIGELTESEAGKAFAKGGQPRIVWGLLQVLNAIHTTVYRTLLYEATEAGNLAQDYDEKVGFSQQEGLRPATVMTHQQWFLPHIAKLKAALAARPKPAVPNLTVSVFGFSRGAAEAAAFCHLFDALLENGALAGVPTSISFLGLFDVVATVSNSASMSSTLPFLPSKFFSGHGAWAAPILEPLPDCIAKGLHCIATHELRMNFPMTQQRGNIKEVFFPGVHSDVGGGYAPSEQGKGRGAQSALLSQIPLLHMFKEARLAGVPLQPYSELEKTVQDDFQASLELASAWNAYTAALGTNGALLKKHMELYYRWRAARLNTLESTSNFKAASAQDQQDMREANDRLKGDLDALRTRRTAYPRIYNDTESKPFPHADITHINQWQFFRAQNGTPLDDWEHWALDIFENPKPLPADVERFFDDYVHDSFAGFYMAGEVTDYDKRVKIAAVMKKKTEYIKGFDKKVYDKASKTKAAQNKKKAGESLSPQEEELVSQAEYGTPYPIMTDADTKDMRNVLITTQTASRNEGGGYVLRRGYYPQEGFFLRKSINEKKLQESPTAYNSRKNQESDNTPVEFVWSNNLRYDVAQANLADQKEIG